MKLNVNEIFYSIQGESLSAGLPSIFIRLTGCNLNCAYCDTEYAKNEGQIISIDAILDIVKKQKSAEHVTITGGEPLLQEETIDLIKKLIENKFKIQIETNGSKSLKNIPVEVRKIVDIKTPSSKEENSFLLENIKFLTEADELKFVISDMIDYEFAKKYINNHFLNIKSTINFSPAFKMMEYSQLADLLLKDQLKVRLNLQLHKIIWDKENESKIEIILDKYI